MTDFLFILIAEADEGNRLEWPLRAMNKHKQRVMEYGLLVCLTKVLTKSMNCYFRHFKSIGFTKLDKYKQCFWPEVQRKYLYLYLILDLISPLFTALGNTAMQYLKWNNKLCKEHKLGPNSRGRNLNVPLNSSMIQENDSIIFSLNHKHFLQMVTKRDLESDTRYAILYLPVPSYR